MNEFFDELFTGTNVVPVKPNAAATERKRPQKSVPPKKADTSAPRGEKPTAARLNKTSDDPKIKEPQCSGVLESVSNACNGNRYLEAMILGEILNKPRFKGLYRR